MTAKSIVLFCLTAGCVLVEPTPAQKRDSLPPPASFQVDYLRDVKPILQTNCYSCHGPSQQVAGLRLDLRRMALRGGDSGTVFVSGHSADSKLILRLVGSELGVQMPPTGPISAEEIGILRAWIDQGLPWADASLEDVAAGKAAAVDPKGAPLFRAIRGGDIGKVRALLAGDRSLVNVRDIDGVTPLMYAALYGTQECLRFLLDQGADPNARNSAGVTALMWAVGDVDKVRLLVSRGADVNAKSNEGKTPLSMAAQSDRNAAPIKFLLEKGADVTAKDSAGLTALIEAALAADADMTRLLLDKGADIHARAGSGLTALIAAAGTECLRCVDVLLSHGADPKVTTKRGITPLIAVASSGSAEIVRALLATGADPNAKTEEGHTALMRAAYSDFVALETVRLLLAAGADGNARSGDGHTALTLARRRGDSEVVKVLRQAGAEE
ncbi:MAG: ankyrin repeat domain-containing protein [Acidobacteriota bacterium]